MSGPSLGQWLERLAGLHPREIDLGLERVAGVARALGVERPAPAVVTVAGTNGKGSVCAFLEALLTAHGARVAAYGSPHLNHFRERIRLEGREAADADIVGALERVEQARGDTSLTFFEFTTLAALDLFARAEPDVAILEVGLGGRLDAVNVVDADLAVVTAIGLDHAEWLGHDLDMIAAEKAGIARAGRPLLSGDPAAPTGLQAAAERIGARLLRAGTDFGWSPGEGGTWRAWTPGWEADALPAPALAGGYQRANAACALAAVEMLGWALDTRAVACALRAARVPGRFEIREGPVEVVLDVAHNPQAAGTLADALVERASANRTRLVLAMYRDKDAAGVVGALAGVVDAWFTAPLPPPRGADAATLGEAIAAAAGCRASAFRDPAAALQAAMAESLPGDRVVVAGSFETVAAVSRWLDG